MLVWGCDVIAKHLDDDRGQFESWGWRGIFIRYNQQTGGYRVLNLRLGTVAATRDIIAHETDFTHMNSFAAKYHPAVPVVNGYVDKNPFELLRESNLTMKICVPGMGEQQNIMRMRTLSTFIPFNYNQNPKQPKANQYLPNCVPRMGEQ